MKSKLLLIPIFFSVLLFSSIAVSSVYADEEFIVTGDKLYRVTQDGTVSIIANVNADHVVVDSNGDLIIVNGAAGSLQRVTQTGNISTIHSGLGPFPVGVAINGTGAFIVTNSAGMMFGIVDGQPLQTITTGLGSPQGIVVDSNGNYIVSDSNSPFRLLNVTSIGSVNIIQSGFAAGLNDVTINPNGGFTVTVAPSADLIQNVTSTGTVTTVASAVGDARGITVDSGGDFIISTSGGLLKRVTPDGVISTIVSGGLGFADGVTSYSPPTIKITKNATNSDGAFVFTIVNATDITNSTMVSIPNTVVSNMTSPLSVLPGSYNVTETIPTDWTLNDSDCEKNGISLGTVLNFIVAPGDVIECIFTNTFASLSIDATSATGTGSITLTTSSGGITQHSTSTANSHSGIPNYPVPSLTFPHGLVSWTVDGLMPGETISMEIVYPDTVPINAKYWKVNGSTWTNATSLITSNTGNNILTLTITDGGFGDADGLVNGEISDPGGVGFSISEPEPEDKNNPCDALEKAENSGKGKHKGILKAKENNDCN